MARLIQKAVRGIVALIAAAAFILMFSESEDGFVTWVNFASMGVAALCFTILSGGDKDGKGKDIKGTDRHESK